MKLTRAGTGVAPKLDLSGPPKTTLRELQFDGTDGPYDEHFGAGIAFYNMERPRSVVYLDQVLTAGSVQTNFPLNGLAYTDSEAHDLSHAYQQSLTGSVIANIVEGPLAELNSPNSSDLKPDEVVPSSPRDGADMFEGRDGVDQLVFNDPNTLGTVGISASGANVTMDLSVVEPITFHTLSGAANMVINDPTGTNLQAAGIGSWGGAGQVDRVTVNDTAGNEIIDAFASAEVTGINGTSAPVATFQAQTGDQLVVNDGASNDTIEASSLPLGTITPTLDGAPGDDAFFGEKRSELVLGRAGNNALSAGIASGSSTPAVGDEFIGPFPSWTNVKTVYGAKGDGITDDTAAIQAALSN